MRLQRTTNLFLQKTPCAPQSARRSISMLKENIAMVDVTTDRP